MRKIKILIMLMVSGFLFQSCLKDRDAEKRAEELRVLEQYILNNNITVSPTQSGLYYIEEEAGTGVSPTGTCWLEFSYTGRIVSNPDAIIMTSDSLTAIDNSIYNSMVLYGPRRVFMNQIILEGLFEGISKMKEGGKARLIFPSSIGYGASSFGNLPPYSTLIMDIELVHVIPNIIQFERTQMDNYLIANNITDDSTSTGLVYHKIVEGTGNFPTTGSQVTISYKCSFLNGKIFTQTEKTIPIGYNQVISGVEEGLKLMKKGGKAKLIVPYYLAYGEIGYVIVYNNEEFTRVWPFTTLVFDIEITDMI